MNSTYTAVTPEDRQIMLAQIGVKTVEELFENIPSSLRLDRALDLPQGLSEQEVYQHLAELAAKNISCEEEISFLGGGMYDHYVPALIDMLLERSEFLTPYTPYQPEISQGSLQAMFEYQTAISELTALPVANASLYDGPSAVGAAGYLAKLVNGRKKLVVSAGLHPHSIATLKTLSRGYGMDVVEVPLQANGLTDQDALAEVLAEDVAAVFLQQPNVFGVLEDIEHLTELIHTKTSNDAARPQHALAVTAVDPIVLGVIKAPGECGVDIALGEGQPLGNRLDFGGPSFGFFAAREEYIRKMPGRIAGETVDVDGRRGFVLTLQTREQHIRREKATSNICTAQALNALAGTIYLSWLGRRGIVELGELLIRRTAYARQRLVAIPGVHLLHDQPVAREFAITLPIPAQTVIERAREFGVAPGVSLKKLFGETYGEGLLIAITERRSREDIDRLATVLTTILSAETGDTKQPFTRGTGHAESLSTSFTESVGV